MLRLIRAGKSCQIWEVFREDGDSHRCVLKVLRDDYRRSREELALLKHEFTVGRELDHPKVIRIHEFDIVRGIPFLALDFFESVNLKQWLRLPESDRTMLASMIEQSAEALVHMHQRGWVHRDVKPDNLLVNAAGEVKLIDFAIAQRIRRGLSRWLPGRGKVQGTRSYMSPEQIRNEPLDPRSDVYSFGCVVYELVSGKPPFTGGSADELLQRHLSAPVPSILAADATVSEELAGLVARCMAKPREDRPESMEAFLDSFRSLRLPFGRPR
jgi:serine/threonine protein kinase